MGPRKENNKSISQAEKCAELKEGWARLKYMLNCVE